MNTHNLSMVTSRVRVPPDNSAATTWVKAAGSADITSSTIDTLGYEGVLIRIGFGAITSGAATSIKLTHSSDDSSYADVAGTAQTVADTADNTVFEIEIWRPQKRYLRVVTSRATQNSAVDFLEAFLYKPHHANPVTQGVTVGGTEQFNSPASGTA